jgi:dUTPase
MAKAVSTTTKIKILDERAVVPQRAHESDSGYDLTLIDIKTIKGDTIYFRTGIAVQPESGFYFEIVPRSSISSLPFVLANSVAVIDEHYTGEILIPVRVTHPNLGQDVGRTRFPNGVVRVWDARPQTLYDVGQLLLRKKPVMFQMLLRKRLDTEFERALELEDTSRGDGGFGSTDAKAKSGVTKASTRKSIVKRVED